MEIEERKDRARMIGMGPHLLLSSSHGTLAPQGNIPVSGQQLVGTGSSLHLTPLLCAQSQVNLKGFSEAMRGVHWSRDPSVFLSCLCSCLLWPMVPGK